MVSITANANGDSMATITPADSQSHLVAITGPPALVTDCPACSADDVTPQGSVPVPGNPAQLLVIGDTTTFPTNCPNTKIRIVAYQIQDASSVDFKINIPTKEQFGSKSSNTCNTTITTSEICSDTPSGIIHDTLSVGCNSVGGSCGYTYANQQWSSARDRLHPYLPPLAIWSFTTIQFQSQEPRAASKEECSGHETNECTRPCMPRTRYHPAPPAMLGLTEGNNAERTLWFH